MTQRGHPDDQWLVNGQPAFGYVPGGLIEACATTAPIYLFHGDAAQGAHHIATKHGHWVQKNGGSVPELVWKKCHQSGKAFFNDDEARKLNLSLQLSPSALLVLRYEPAKHFFNVVTLYYREQAVDGDFIGRFVPERWEGGQPQFSLQFFAPPVVIVKKKRALVLPST